MLAVQSSFGRRNAWLDLCLGWVNLQVMRKSHSCIAAGKNIDPQVRADQMGHTVDVNQNVYTRSSLERRIEAVNAIEKALTM